MEEVIVIRIIDSDGSAFASIMSALQEKHYKIVDMSVIDRPAVNIGEIKIYPSCHQVFLQEKRSNSTAANMPCSTVWQRRQDGYLPARNFTLPCGTKHIPMVQIQ